MDSLKFGAIEKFLNDTIKELKDTLKPYYDNEKSFYKFQICDYNYCIRFARRKISEMDKFEKNDIYHIIGMGELTPYQSYRFCTLVAEYGKFKSDLHYISGLVPVDVKGESNRKETAKYTLSMNLELEATIKKQE